MYMYTPQKHMYMYMYIPSLQALWEGVGQSATERESGQNDEFDLLGPGQ